MPKKTKEDENHIHFYKVTTLEKTHDVYEALRCATCGIHVMALRFKKFLTRLGGK